MKEKKTTSKQETKEVKKLLKGKMKKYKVTTADYVHTGSTMLNCALTGHPMRGFRKGGFYYFVGDSASGKTFFCLTCFAEATLNKHFDDYDLIYDNIEGGALMDIQKFFGTDVSRRMQSPLAGNSQTIEDMYYNLHDACESGRPFIYVTDSMDSLSSKSEGEKFVATKKAKRAGKKIAGSFGDGKARINSMCVRQFLKPLKDTGSILIIINQTRANFDPMSFEKTTRSGGKALGFYNNLEIWSSVKSRIKKTVRGQNLEIGSLCKLQVKKNRETGARRAVFVPIYHSYGIDDIGSCIEFLIDTEHWAMKKNTIIAHDFDLKGTPEKLIHLIEDNDLLKDLRDLVGEVCNEIEDGAKLKRKKRYA